MADGESDNNDTLQHLVDSLNLEGPAASWPLAYTRRPSEAGPADEGGAGPGGPPSNPAGNPARSTAPSFQRSLFSSGSLPRSAHRQSLSSARSTPALTSPPAGGGSGSVRRLSAMSISASPTPSSSSAVRSSNTRFAADPLSRITTLSCPVPAAQKDGDDPTTPVESSRPSEDGRYSTPTALTRLLAAEMPASPESSRNASYSNGNFMALATTPLSDASTLPEHLYTRGFLGGRHSDITLVAFGQRYPLHRLILDRAPFFMNGLSEPWVESSQREVPLFPEELDSNITKTSFELALKKLYGVDISADEDAEAIGLFATGCWLEMQDLVDAAVESILRQMAPDNLASLIRFVTNSYYGKAGERILASARAMLCRDGSEMPLKYWDSIPADVIKDVVGGDGFYISGEWERWYLSRRLLDKRLKRKAVEVGIIPQYAKTRPQAPADMWLQAVRSDPTYRTGFQLGSLEVPESVQKWCSLYTHPEVEPLIALLHEGIYYAHLEFEQLTFIRESRDIFGQPVVPDRLIMEAQWQQLELRSKVLGARENDLELGLSLPLDQDVADPDSPCSNSSKQVGAVQPKRASPSKGKGKASDADAESASAPAPAGSVPLNSQSVTGEARTIRFTIPREDCNIVVGGNSDPVVTASSTVQRSAPGEATDVLHGGPIPTAATDRPVTPGGTATSTCAPRPDSYSTFPPFRFSAEFPNPRQLKEKKRVYSRTVFYAGSLWNVYIQKVRSARNPQLGVYLHRAKERELDEGVISGVGVAPGQASYLMSGGNVIGAYGSRSDSVDEQIGRLEREMLLRGERREHNRALRAARHRSVQSQPMSFDATRANGADDTSGSGEDAQPAASTTSTSARLASYGRQRTRHNRSNEAAVRTSLQQSWAFPAGVDADFSPSSSGTDDDDSPDEDDMFNAFSTIPRGSLSSRPEMPSATAASAADTSPTSARRPRKLIVRSSTGQIATPGPAAIARDQRERSSQAAASGAVVGGTGTGTGRPGISRMPTLPPYVDARPTIRTWFKIYSPSRGGRLLSVYESAPDQFNFSQSWGWKSGSLMLDDGFGASGGNAGSLGSAADLDAGEDGAERETQGLADKAKKRWKSKGEGKLRFMVVIGNL